MRTFDHIILGTGQSTGTLMGGLLPKGESIAIIEKNKIGGTCVNTGCTPTKTLVSSARVAHVIRRAPEYGIHAGECIVDFQAVMARMNEVRSQSGNGLEKWITSQEQITLFREQGEFVSERVIQVGGTKIEGKNIYINVGTRPFVPEIPGLAEVDWLDNAGILELDTLPEHLIIVGGSYIGLEFGQIFKRFGSKVSILNRGGQLMNNEDGDVATCVQEILEGEGVEFYLNTRIKEVNRTGDHKTKVVIEQNGTILELVGSHLLIATGRIPNSDLINHQAAGLAMDAHGYIFVDEFCRTNVEGIFAVGDVNGKGAFTHTAVNDAEIVLDYHKGGPRRLSDRIPVYALFVDPPLGRVGLTEKEALSQGYNVLKATREMSRISRAKEMGETQGFAKLLVDAETDLILGASILGPGGDEIVNMFAAYMYSGLPCKNYRRSVLVHPTISELMPWVLDSLAPVN